MVSYKPIEDALFFLATFFSINLALLNEPDLKIECTCSGRMLKYRVTSRGSHYLCLRCFTRWVKPTRGMLYKENRYVRKAGKRQTA